MLRTGIGIGIGYWYRHFGSGQYYWILDIGLLSWYRSNPIYVMALTKFTSLIFDKKLVCTRVNNI